MKFFRALILVFLLFPSIIHSQQKTKYISNLGYDNLKQNYNKAIKKSQKIKYAKLYLNKAIKEKSNIHIAKGFYWFALLEYDIDNIKTLQLLDSVIKYSKNNLEDKFFPAAAYCDKAIFLIKDHKYNEAVKNYKNAETYAIKNNLNYYYVIRQNIAITKSENLGEVDEALDIYKECYNYYKSRNIRDESIKEDYQSVLFGLADVYKALKKIDSCTYYNKLGCIETKATNNEYYYYMFVLNEGANQVLRKNYTAAIDSINIALPKLKSLKNQGNIFASYFYYGKAYEGLGNSKQAVINYKKIDSMYSLDRNIITPEFTDGYLYLIKYYKNSGDKTNQLKYLTTYMRVDSTLQKNYKELNKLLQKDYDFPHMVKEKETLIESLKNKNKIYYWGIASLLFIVVGLMVYQQHMKKTYQLRFNKIIEESTTIKHNENSTIIDTKDKVTYETLVDNSSKIKTSTISEVIVNQILRNLEDFENENDYLNNKVSIKTLSEKFETNSRYLSIVVNEYKEKTFINYINDLRIDYAIYDLQKNRTVRKYTLQALAVEYGFNNAESFSTAFSKKTGLKPIFFIKELENKTN